MIIFLRTQLLPFDHVNPHCLVDKTKHEKIFNHPLPLLKKEGIKGWLFFYFLIFQYDKQVISNYKYNKAIRVNVIII